MLANVGGHERLSPGDLVELLDDGLRLYKLAVMIVVEALDVTPGLDLLPPFCKRFGIGLAVFAIDELDQVREHRPCVTHDRDLHGDVLADRGRIDVDVDYLGVRTELGNVARDAVVEARSDGEQHVAIVHGHVGLVGAVHAQHADEQRVCRGESAKRHERIGARIPEQAHELRELGLRATHDHTAAYIDHRPLRLQQQIGGTPDLFRMALASRRVGTHLERLGIQILHLLRGDVLGNVDDHRARPSRGGDVEGFLHRRREVADILDQKVVLDARPGDADRVHLLEGVVADELRGHLTGDDHHRDRVHVRRRNPGDRVGHAGPGGDQHDTRLARSPGVSVRGVGGPLLVSHQNVLYLVLLIQGVVDMQGRAAGITEYVINPFVLKAANDDLSTGQFHAKTLTLVDIRSHAVRRIR